MKKYELTDETKVIDGHALHRIKALKDFTVRDRIIKEGDVGGWIESEENLSQEGSCWIFDEGKVYGNALVLGKASVSERAMIFEDAVIGGRAKIYGSATVGGYATVSENAKVFEASCVFGRATVGGYAIVCGNSDIDGNTIIR